MDGVNEDPRKTALKRGLRQLTASQLFRVLNYSYDMVLDDCNYRGTPEATFCPLAIGLGLDMTNIEWTDESLVVVMETLGYVVYNTRGVKGSYYTTNRLKDLKDAGYEVLHEKLK